MNSDLYVTQSKVFFHDESQRWGYGSLIIPKYVSGQSRQAKTIKCKYGHNSLGELQ